MNVGKAVYGILSANSGVTDIVGTNIFPEIAEQETAVPFIVYQLQNVAPEDTHDGPSKLDEVQFEFLCYADSYNAAADLGVAVRAALDRVSGTYNGVNVESVQFNDVDIEIEYDPRRYSQVLKFTFRIKRDDVTIALGTPVTGAVLGDLSDVNVTGVTNGQLIAYNSTTGNWEAADDAGGAERLTQLQDTQILTPANGEFLKYDGDNWVNDNVSKTDVGLSNVDNTSDANKPVSTATQTALNAKADTSAVPTELNDLSDVTITGTPTANEALIFDTATSSFKSLPNFTNRFEDEAETNKQAITPFAERVYTVKSDGDGIFIDPESDTPTAGKVIERKIYHKTGFLESGAVIGDFTLIHTFADDTAYSATTSTFEGFRDGDTYGTPPFTLIQTWEEVAAAPAFTGLLNESYGSGAAAAYSVRRLNGNYTGAAIQVERSSDNSYQDIGFDSNGDLDESALTTFCTGTTCKVRTWYDQSVTGGTGSGNDAVQTTHANQPTIYTGGAIVKVNGRVAVDFDGAGDNMVSTGFGTGSERSIFNATKGTGDPASGYANYWIFLESASVSTTGDFLQLYSADYDASFAANFLVNGLDITASTGLQNQSLVTLTKSTSASNLYKDGTTIGSGSGTQTLEDELSIGKFQSNHAPQKQQELIVYNSNKATDRTNIESNIGDYFTQNTPLLDTYSGAAAAYSLRLLDSTYSGSAIRVRRASDNAEADIGFNVFGELSTVELAAHCGSSDGFVKTWYSQVGTGVDATQTTAANQPKIYDSVTGVVTENGKPAVQFDGSNDVLSGSSINPTNNLTMVTVYNCSTANTFNTLFGQGRGFIGTTETNTDFSYGLNGNNVQPDIQNTNLSAVISLSASTTRNKQELGELYYSRNATAYVYVDGSLGDSAATPDYPIRDAHVLSIGDATFPPNAKIQEAIVYNSDQSSNRTGIESNINTFYSIY